MASIEENIPTEILESSDEDYSEEEEDEETLEQAAIPQVRRQPSDKSKQIDLLLKRKRFTQFHVKKSLKWLHNKPKRENARCKLKERARKFIAKNKECREIADVEEAEVEEIPDKEETIDIYATADESALANTLEIGNAWEDVEEQIVAPIQLTVEAPPPLPKIVMVEAAATHILPNKIDDEIEILSDMECQEVEEHVEQLPLPLPQKVHQPQQLPLLEEVQQLPLLEKHQEPIAKQQPPPQKQRSQQQEQPELIEVQQHPKLQQHAALDNIQINLSTPPVAEVTTKSNNQQELTQPQIQNIFDALQMQMQSNKNLGNSCSDSVNGAQSNPVSLIQNLLKFCAQQDTVKNQQNQVAPPSIQTNSIPNQQLEEAAQQMETDNNTEVQSSSRKRPRSVSPIERFCANETNAYQRPKTDRIEESRYEEIGTQTDEASTVIMDITQNEEQPKEPAKPLSITEQLKKSFAEHNAMLNNHLKEHTTLRQIESQLIQFSTEIESLNVILADKEFEWDRILQLKKVKEEMLGRLMRKKVIFEKSKMYNVKDTATLLELRELETFLSGGKPQQQKNQHQSKVEQILEKNARVLKEKSEIGPNYLQTLLQSRNGTSNKNNDVGASPTATSTRANSFEAFDVMCQQNEVDDLTKQYQQQQMQYLESKSQQSNLGMGRQGQTVNVKSLIADYRQKHPDSGLRSAKRMRLNESVNNINRNQYMNDVGHVSIEPTNNPAGQSSYTSTLEKLLSAARNNDAQNMSRPTPYIPRSPSPSPTLRTSQMLSSLEFPLNHVENNTYNRLRANRVKALNEVSIIPISKHNRYYHKGEHALLRTALHANSHNLQSSGAVYVGGNGPYERQMDANNILGGGKEMQLCQGCKANEAQFICAGCGNQWYCSRSCQENAWDDHSIVCTD